MGKRARSRSVAKAAQARYDAAGTGRRFAGWNTPSTGPNTAIAGLQRIRDRSRDVARNQWSGASTVRVMTTNLIGTGIVPRFTETPETKGAKRKLTELWDATVAVIDADCVLDFYGLEALVARSWGMSGEVFVRERPRRIMDGLPVPFQIQVLESDMCPLLDADVYEGMPDGNRIRQGVEFDQIGRRVAFWFYREHPGERMSTSINPSQLSRVPAENVYHIFEPTRPGQIRGVSDFAPVIARLKNTDDFDDSLLERQRLANLFTAFITRGIPSGGNDPMTGLPFQGMPDEPLMGMEPGSTVELLPGEDVKFSNPPGADASYMDFMRMQHLGISAGAGTPYELMTGDIKDVSDRSLRIIINEFRRFCEQRQWLYIIPQFCKRVIKSWARYALLSGAITEAEFAIASTPKWSPQGWAYIHPVQDVQAKGLEVDKGFRARSDVISERGDDPDAVDEARAADKAREDRLGLQPAAAPDPASNSNNGVS